jgi:hypothetical protein
MNQRDLLEQAIKKIEGLTGVEGIPLTAGLAEDFVNSMGWRAMKGVIAMKIAALRDELETLDYQTTGADDMPIGVEGFTLAVANRQGRITALREIMEAPENLAANLQYLEGNEDGTE